MREILIDVPYRLKDNIMFKVIVELKEFSLIENILGFKIGDEIVLQNEKCIIKDLEILDDKLKFYIE